MSHSLGVFKFTTLGAAYVAANQMYSRTDLELIEFCPLGENAQLILKGDEIKINEFRKSLRQADFIRTSITEDKEDKILGAYLSFESKNPETYLLIYESNFLGDLFEVAKNLLSKGASLIDIRQQKNSITSCHLLATGDDIKNVDHFISDLKRENKKITVIEPLASGLSQFLSVVP